MEDRWRAWADDAWLADPRSGATITVMSNEVKEDPLAALRRELDQRPAGPIETPGLSELVAQAWALLRGTDEPAPPGEIIDAAWDPPVLSFSLRRGGKRRGTLPRWYLDLRARTATERR